jgi:hypothetical protein
MQLALYSQEIAAIVAANDHFAQRALMLLDRYECADDKDEFVSALVHRLMVAQARCQAMAISLSARAV